MLIYNFDSNKVRVIFGDDEPYFVVEDICDILKIPDGRLSDEDKITHKLNDEQEIIVTSEFGLYELIMNSVGEKEFKRWMLRELLPTIRKTAQLKSFPSQEMIYVLAIQKKVTYSEIDDKAYFTFNATAKLCGTGNWGLKKDLIDQDKVYQLLGWYTQADLANLDKWIKGRTRFSDVTIAKIIEYYAFDAPESNDRAKDTFKAFAPIGIRNWAKQAVQYVEKEPIDTEPKEILASINEKLNAIQETFQELSQQLSETEN